MNSTELCTALLIDSTKLAALVAAGVPRQKLRGKWVYDLASVRAWLRAKAQKARASETSGKPLATPENPASTEIIARTVPECLRVMAELGYPKSDRVFRTWMTQPLFPGTPGNKGKQDGEFPVYAILKWAGEIGDAGQATAQVSKGPKEEIWTTRAEREKLELEAYKKNLLERNLAEATLLRCFAVVASAFEALPDELVAALPEEAKARARSDLEERLRKTLEVLADTLWDEEDGES